MVNASGIIGSERVRKKDRRSLYTEGAIKDALLHEIASASYANASISSVCRRAEITRPTFYLHYDNLSSVLDELIEDVTKEIGDIPMELCDKCGTAVLADTAHPTDLNREQKKPFCQIVLGEGKYAPLFMDDYIAGHVVERIVDDYTRASIEAGLSAEDARRIRTLNLFRMSGCMAAAKSFRHTGDDWEEAMPVIDRFVASGFRAMLDDDKNYLAY